MVYNLKQPWARQPCDNDLTWVLFQTYLLLEPPRTLGRMAKHNGTSLPAGQLSQIADQGAWKRRAEAWDVHLDALRMTTVEKVTVETAAERARRQGNLGKKMQRLADSELTKVLSVAERGDMMLGTISVDQAVRLARHGQHIERLAMGDVTEKVETVDLSKLSIEELRMIQELQEKVTHE